jgi:DNA-directed RNA polymerase specialized sigma24 family protein
MLDMSPEFLAELEKRGRNYARVLGLDTCDIDEVIGRSFLRLCERAAKVDMSPEDISKLWRSMVYQSVANDHRQRRRQHLLAKVNTGIVLYQESPEEIMEQIETLTTLEEVFSYLSEDDILLILSYADCGYNIKATAEYMGLKPRNVYFYFARLRDRLAPFFPQTKKHRSGVKSARRRKYKDWHFTYQIIERVLYHPDWLDGLWDHDEAAKSHECTSYL